LSEVAFSVVVLLCGADEAGMVEDTQVRFVRA